MNLTTIAGHTFDLDRLPEQPAVLDVGCRGFDFTSGILALRPEAGILAMDPDPIIVDPQLPNCAFLRFALVGDDRVRSKYTSYSTGEGNFLTEALSYYDSKIIEVDCVNIRELTTFHGGPWDLVKLDCEGSEFQILEHWPGPIATQLSIEFHDWTDKDKRDKPDYYELLFSLLGKFGYEVIRHELTDISGRGAWGHWDSILALR